MKQKPAPPPTKVSTATILAAMLGSFAFLCVCVGLYILFEYSLMNESEETQAYAYVGLYSVLIIGPSIIAAIYLWFRIKRK